MNQNTTFTYGFNIELINKQLSERTLSLDECNQLRDRISTLRIDIPAQKHEELIQLDYELYKYKKMIRMNNSTDDSFLSELELQDTRDDLFMSELESLKSEEDE